MRKGRKIQKKMPPFWWHCPMMRCIFNGQS